MTDTEMLTTCNHSEVAAGNNGRTIRLLGFNGSAEEDKRLTNLRVWKTMDGMSVRITRKTK